MRERRRQANSRLLATLREMPSVRSAALTNGLPTSGFRTRIVTEGAGGHAPRWVTSAWISDGFFGTLGIPLLRGRDFSTGVDHLGGVRVAIASSDLAAALWGKEEPIGRRVAIAPNGDESPQWIEVVGVAGAVSGIGNKLSPTLYLSLSQQSNPLATSLVVQASLPTAEIESQLSSIVTGTADGIGITSVHTLLSSIDAVLFALRAMAAFLVGSKEIALRRALGSGDLALIGFLVRDTMKMTSLGVVLGCCITPFVAGMSQVYLGSVAGTHAREALASAMLMLCVAVIASCIPASRATKQDVADLLRRVQA